MPHCQAISLEQGRARMRIGGEVEHVAEIGIDHLAERDDLRKADAARRRPIEHRRDHGTRLADEGDVAGRPRKMREAGVQADPRHNDADAIRADEAQQVGPGRVERRLPQRASGIAFLAEPGGNEDCRLCAALAEPTDEGRTRTERRRMAMA